MIEETAFIVAIFLAAGADPVLAQDATPIAQVTAHISTKEMGHDRIVTLQDRIESQRQRIVQGLTDHRLTAEQAETCRMNLDSVENKMKDERQANGPKKIMRREVYDAYNTALDANSNLVGEQRQYFYYYGPVADSGPYYDYYYDAYPRVGSPTPDVSSLEKTEPRIFELRTRIKAQRARIQQALDNHGLTSGQAANCGVILNGVEQQMKKDYEANHSNKLTRAQYTSLNNSLDKNSDLIQESKQYFYYYDDPNYVQYYWN